jgi:hypothetical protein
MCFAVLHFLILFFPRQLEETRLTLLYIFVWVPPLLKSLWTRKTKQRFSLLFFVPKLHSQKRQKTKRRSPIPVLNFQTLSRLRQSKSNGETKTKSDRFPVFEYVWFRFCFSVAFWLSETRECLKIQDGYRWSSFCFLPFLRMQFWDKKEEREPLFCLSCSQRFEKGRNSNKYI